jgi:hypothetical protein
MLAKPTTMCQTKIGDGASHMEKTVNWYPSRIVHRLFATMAFAALLGPLVPRAGAQVVRGIVRELISQRPLTSINVALLDAKDSVLRTTVSDRGGTFRFLGVAPGAYSLSLRGIGFETLMTTPFRVAKADTIILAFTLEPIARNLDTVRVQERKSGVTPGRQQFLEHYRRGVGLFISGAEIEASKKSVGEYVAQLPGFSDYGTNKPPSTNGSECRSINTILRGGTVELNTERIGAGSREAWRATTSVTSSTRWAAA